MVQLECAIKLPHDYFVIINTTPRIWCYARYASMKMEVNVLLHIQSYIDLFFWLSIFFFVQYCLTLNLNTSNPITVSLLFFVSVYHSIDFVLWSFWLWFSSKLNVDVETVEELTLSNIAILATSQSFLDHFTWLLESIASSFYIMSIKCT